MLLLNPLAEEAIHREFEAFLTICRPLMDIMRPADEDEKAELKEAFRNSPGELLSAERSGLTILLKREISALVVKEEPPYAAFIVKEPRMLAALEQYLQNA